MAAADFLSFFFDTKTPNFAAVASNESALLAHSTQAVISEHLPRRLMNRETHSRLQLLARECMRVTSSRESIIMPGTRRS